MRYLFCLVLTLVSVSSLRGDLVTFQQGFNTYGGAVDNTVFSQFPSQGFGGAIEIAVDGNDGGFVSQGLVRFNNIFGASTGTILPGSIIQSASLRVYTNSSFNGTVTSPQGAVTFHRMLQDWDGNSSWNTFGGNGIQANGVEARGASSVSFSTAADETYLTLDVTSDLQAWANGESNFGWAVLNPTTDGWDFWSSSFDASDAPSTIEARPLLTVNFTAVPEPGSMAFAGLALAGFALRRYRLSGSIVKA